MIKFDNVGIYNWKNAIRGMRNSWESWDKMDSEESPFGVHIGEEDFALMKRLVLAGSDHAKFLRQILISVDITAPEKWWSEADTYKVATVANSTSMMHTLGRTPLEAEHCSFEDLDEDLREEFLNIHATARERWIASGSKKPSREWRQMVMLTPVGFNYRRTFTANYQTLRAMYHSRHNHRLEEWRVFADWCETLPYSELITIKKRRGSNG